jgi:arylsulfatase
MVDDMGFSDIGCYGGEISTPNLDALAAGGVRFTQFYNTGRCCPTRASLLTGLYSHQAGVGAMTGDAGLPGYRGFLNDRCVTIAEVLRPAGYFTAHTGKWHVGHGDDSRLPPQRGFDRFYGVPEGGGFYFKLKEGRTIRLDNEILHSVDKPLPQGWYSTDAWTEYGLRFIDEARSADKPFFLYLAHNAPHFPLQAAPEDIAKFRGQYKAGWDQVRQQRYSRLKELGVVSADWPLPARDATVAAWDALTPQQQDDLDHRMTLHAAVMHRLDRSIGTLVAGLKERGALENTLLLFLSDNGASDEGGIATPLIAHWPAGISAHGQWCTQPTHIIDLMATCVDLAGAAYPATYNGKPIEPMEGVSLQPLFTSPSESLPGPRTLYWEHLGHAAVRTGDMKLVRQGRSGPWELYDMAADRTELNNLAPEFPDQAKALAGKWEAWAKRAQVKPYPSQK